MNQCFEWVKQLVHQLHAWTNQCFYLTEWFSHNAVLRSIQEASTYDLCVMTSHTSQKNNKDIFYHFYYIYIWPLFFIFLHIIKLTIPAFKHNNKLLSTIMLSSKIVFSLNLKWIWKRTDCWILKKIFMLKLMFSCCTGNYPEMILIFSWWLTEGGFCTMLFHCEYPPPWAPIQ